MNRPQVVSAAEWQAARERLLIEEKEARRNGRTRPTDGRKRPHTRGGASTTSTTTRPRKRDERARWLPVGQSIAGSLSGAMISMGRLLEKLGSWPLFTRVGGRTILRSP
jgi:hypothetical protein